MCPPSIDMMGIAEPEGEDESPSYNFDTPEDVLFEVYWDTYPDGSDFRVVEVWAAPYEPLPNAKRGVISYEQSENGLLDYTVRSWLAADLPEGFYVLEDVTGYYSRGDGWMTDDDMEFYMGDPRPATVEEIAAQYGVSFWDNL